MGRSGSYEEFQYWNKRQDPNASEGWEPEHLRITVEYLRSHTKGCSPVLELGPGVGRTLSAYARDTTVHAYDISALYRERLMERARELGLSVTLDIASEDTEGRLPYEDGVFQAGVACQVFLHQRPERIERVMGEMVRVCRKVVVVSGRRVARKQSRDAHCYSHDYPELCVRIGCEMNHVRTWGEHILFVYQRV